MIYEEENSLLFWQLISFCVFLQSLEGDHHQSEAEVEAVCSVDARSNKVRKMKGRLFIYYCLDCLMTPAFCWKFGSFEYDEEVIDFTDMGSYNHGFQKNLNTGRNGLKPPGVVEGN